MWQHKNTEWLITRSLACITKAAFIKTTLYLYPSIYFSYKPKSSPELIICGPIAAINSFHWYLEAMYSFNVQGIDFKMILMYPLEGRDLYFSP
jgi:hypothetical protein